MKIDEFLVTLPPVENPKPAAPSRHHAWDELAGVWVDQRTLEQAKDDAWETIKHRREQAFAARAVSPHGVPYSIALDKANLSDRILSLEAAIAIGVADETTAIKWQDRDNAPHMLSITGLRMLAAAMGARGQAIFEHSWSLNNQVKAATSKAQIAAINLEAGWP